MHGCAAQCSVTRQCAITRRGVITLLPCCLEEDCPEAPPRGEPLGQHLGLCLASCSTSTFIRAGPRWLDCGSRVLGVGAGRDEDSSVLEALGGGAIPTTTGPGTAGLQWQGPVGGEEAGGGVWGCGGGQGSQTTAGKAAAATGGRCKGRVRCLGNVTPPLSPSPARPAPTSPSHRQCHARQAVLQRATHHLRRQL